MFISNLIEVYHGEEPEAEEKLSPIFFDLRFSLTKLRV